MLLADRQSAQHVLVRKCVHVRGSSLACMRAERCENVGGEKQVRGDREGSSERQWLQREKHGAVWARKAGQED